MAPRRGPDRGVAGALLAVVLAGGAPGGVRAHDPAAGAPLQVAADPAQLVLGRDDGADLRIAAPEDVEELSVSTSAGRVEDVKRQPGGGFTARFVAPAGRVPQVAIVAAVARTPRGVVDGWTAIPCSGQADARVHAIPGAEIELTIGGRRFGPRTAGKEGIAVIPIVVPPGVREAHHGFKPIDLGVPETSLLHAVLDRPSVRADRTERVRVIAWVVAPHGAARRGDAPAFEPSRGTVAVTERQPGEIEAVWTLPPGHAGEERMSIRLAGSPASRAVLRLETVVGPPAVVAVSFDRGDVVAGDPEGAALSVRALDAGGNPVRATLEVEAEGATLSDLREPEPGVVVARLRAPASLRGRTEAVVRASAPDAGITGTRKLPLVAGAPARARLAGPLGAVRSGRETALLLRVADAGGNPVSPVPAVTADAGKIVAVEPAEPGAWRVRWVPPAAIEAPSRTRIVASTGAARAVFEPVLLPPRPFGALAASAGASSDLRDGAWGIRSGVSVDLASSLEIPLGAELAWRGEVEAGTLRSHPGVAFLGGASASRVLGPTLVMRASASMGALLSGHSVAPAGRFALGVGRERRGAAPFLEAAVLGATSGRDGAFAAVTMSVGFRLGVER